MQTKQLVLAAIIGMLVLILGNVQAFDYSTIKHKLSRSLLERNPKFFAPVVHPFSDDSELEKENAIDALGGFLSKNTRSVLEGANDMYTLGSIQKMARLNTEHKKRSMLNKMENLGLKVGDKVDYEHPLTKSQTTYNYNAVMHRGTVNMDLEDEIREVSCDTKNSFNQEDEHTIKIQFKNTPLGKQKMKQWVPGTRFVVPSKYGCGTNEANERGESAFYLMVRRSDVTRTPSTVTVSYTARVQRIEQMFVKSSIDFKYKPASSNAKNMEEAMFSDENEDKLMNIAANAQSVVPAPFEKNRRQSINTRKTFDLLNFNYNKSTKRAEKAIEFHSSSTTKVTCTNCFAYLTFEVHFQMVTTWWHIDILKLTVGGKAGARMSTLLDFKYGYHEEFKKTNIFYKVLPRISFSVGVIPVSISPTVSLSAAVKVDVDAKLIVTHDAYYYDGLTLGVEWDRDYKRFNLIKKRKTPEWKVEMPKVDETSHATGEVRVTMKPKLVMSFYSIAPVNLEFLPYIGLKAQVAGGGCGTASASFNTYWGLDMSIQMQPLKIPNSISVIGGYEFDFGGKLPYPKYGNSVFTMVGKTNLNCYYCSGCVNLIPNVRSLASTGSAPTNFKDHLLAAPRSIEGSNELQLGKDFELTLEASECKTYQTTAQILSSDLKYNGADSRAIVMSVSPVAQALKIKTGESTADSTVETVAAGSTYSKKFAFNKVTINVCNEASEKVAFSINTRPYAKVSYGSISVSIPKATAAQLEFVDVKREGYRGYSNKHFVRVSKESVNGDFIMRGRVYSNSQAISDLRTLSSPILSREREHMDLKYLDNALESHNHAENDFSLMLSVMGSEQFDSNTVNLSVGNYLFIENTDREIDVSNINGLHVEATGQYFISQLIAQPTSTAKSFCVVLEENTKGVSSQCFNDISDASFSKVFNLDTRVVEVYNIQLSKLTYKFTQMASSAHYEDFEINSGYSQHFTQSTSSVEADFNEIVATVRKDSSEELKLTIEGFELTDNSNLEQRFSSALHVEEHSVIDSEFVKILDVKKLNSQYGKNLQFRFKLSTTSSSSISGKFVFHEVTTVNSLDAITGGIQTNFDTEMHIYKLSPEFLSNINNHLYMTVIAEKGSPQVVLSENNLPSNYDVDILATHTSTKDTVSFGYGTTPGKTYYIGISTADSNTVLNYNLKMNQIESSDVEFSVVSNPEKTTISDADIREHGLKLTFKIKNGPHQWSPLMTNVYSNRAADLYNMFVSSDEWKDILANFESLRQRALNPSDPFRYDDFIQLTPLEKPTTLTINMPPKVDFFILDPLDVTVSKENIQLSADFFDTHMSNTLTGSYIFSISPNEKVNYYFAIIIVGIIAFVFVTFGFALFLSLILAKAFCKVPKDLSLKKKLSSPAPAAEIEVEDDDNEALIENDSLETRV